MHTFSSAAQRALQGTRDRALTAQPGKKPADLLLLMLLARDCPSLSKWQVCPVPYGPSAQKRSRSSSSEGTHTMLSFM